MIRKYKKSDFSAIATIYNLSKADEFIGESFDATVTPLSEDSEMLSLFHESEIYLYEIDDVVGFIGIKENYISWLFIHPGFRCQGIGKKLVLHILSMLNGEVTLNVAHSNFAAKKMYENLGFKVAKEFVGRYQGNPVIVCNMAIVLENS